MDRIDLRPMSLGEVLDRTFTLYRENFLLFAGIMALPYLLRMVFRLGVLWLQQSTMKQGTGAAVAMPGATTIGVAVLTGLASAVVFVLVIGISQSATVSAVSDLYLGQSTSVRESYRKVKGQVLGVVGTIFLSGLIVGVGLLALLIPGIYLACRLGVAVPARVVEKTSAGSAIGRSMDLTKGAAMQLFLLLLLVGFLTWAVAALLQFPVFFFAFAALKAKHAVSFGVAAYSILAEFLSQALVGPVGTISASLMYYNLRVKKEGFDIQHMLSSLSSSSLPVQETPGI